MTQPQVLTTEPTEDWTAVYRLYDRPHRPLYIGASNDVALRLLDHARARADWHEVARHDIRWYPTRAEALAVESAEIATLNPRWNIEGHPDAAVRRTAVTWHDIVDDIKAKIRSGKLPVGEPIPSGRVLRATYGCSSTPVKMALKVLQTLGLIEGHQGKANYVTADAPSKI